MNVWKNNLWIYNYTVDIFTIQKTQKCGKIYNFVLPLIYLVEVKKERSPVDFEKNGLPFITNTEIQYITKKWVINVAFH